MSQRVHLFTDADNTLWDTNAVFAQAQLMLLQEVEQTTGTRAPASEDKGLAFLRRLDQGIAAIHPDRLRYPPALLVCALEMALNGAPSDDAITQAMATTAPLPPQYVDSINRFIGYLAQTPPLRKSVLEGLTAIAAAQIPITVVSEERLDRCLRRLREHSLEALVGNVVSISKTTANFHKLKRKANADRVVMVGDQLDRDIEAAAAAGFETFYFPGGFQPYWLSESTSAPTRQINQYDEIVPYIVDASERAPA